MMNTAQKNLIGKALEALYWIYLAGITIWLTIVLVVLTYQDGLDQGILALPLWAALVLPVVGIRWFVINWLKAGRAA